MISAKAVRSIDYYLDADHARIAAYYDDPRSIGRWHGTFAYDLGLTGSIEPDEFATLLRGFDPTKHERLMRDDIKVPALDFTFSVPKSYSMYWALGNDEQRRHMLDAFNQGIDQTMTYLQANACFVRRGHAGAEIQPGAGFAAAVFTHPDSRAGDPDLHAHVVILNATRGEDGRVTALDARQLFKLRYTADAIFQAVMRFELARTDGVLFNAPNRHGVAEISGISNRAINHFSKRRREILAEADSRGIRSSEGMQIVTLATREHKATAVTEAELRSRWRTEAAQINVHLRDVAHQRRDPALRVDDGRLATVLTEHAAHFERRDVVRTVAQEATNGATLDAILRRASVYLDSPLAISLGPTAERWTTPEILELERRTIATASRKAEAPTTTADALQAALDGRPMLSAEQVVMVRTLSTSPQTVDIVVGHAGSGKTTALDAYREAAERSGLQIIGTAPSARAAKELQNGAGIASITAARLTGSLRSGEVELTNRSVVVIDEAAMFGTKPLATIVDYAACAGAKVICVGDSKQLPEVDAGGLFSALARRTSPIWLTENRRQRDPAEQQALRDLRAGRVDAALGRLERNGNVTVAANSEQLRHTLVDDWYAARNQGKHALMAAPTRSDVAQLNQLARQRLTADGLLAEPVLTTGTTEYAVGDRVVGLRNRYDLGILNGDTGTVTGATANRGLRLKLDSGLDIDLPMSFLDEGHLAHGYATTVHKAQGMTCDVAFLLGDDGLFAELGYTGLTRGREANRLYTVRGAWDHGRGGDETDELTHIKKALSTSHAQTAASDLLQSIDSVAPKSKGVRI